MQSPFLKAGKIVSPHGLHGEVKIVPWADTPDFLCRFNTLYIDGTPVGVSDVRVHKNTVIAQLEGVLSIGEAEALRNKPVFIDRNDAELPDGRHFIADLIGLDAIDDETGSRLGIISDILPHEPNTIYVIRGERDILVPAVDEFVKKVDIGAGCVRFRLIEGM